MKLGVFGDQRKAETRSLPGRGGGFASGEATEDVAALVLGHSEAVVFDGDAHHIVVSRHLDPVGTAPVAVGVVEEVHDHLADPALVGMDERRCSSQYCHRDFVACPGSKNGLDKLGWVEGLDL